MGEDPFPAMTMEPGYAGIMAKVGETDRPANPNVKAYWSGRGRADQLVASAKVVAPRVWDAGGWSCRREPAESRFVAHLPAVRWAGSMKRFALARRGNNDEALALTSGQLRECSRKLAAKITTALPALHRVTGAKHFVDENCKASFESELLINKSLG